MLLNISERSEPKDLLLVFVYAGCHLSRFRPGNHEPQPQFAKQRRFHCEKRYFADFQRYKSLRIAPNSRQHCIFLQISAQFLPPSRLSRPRRLAEPKTPARHCDLELGTPNSPFELRTLNSLLQIINSLKRILEPCRNSVQFRSQTRLERQNSARQQKNRRILRA